MKTQFTVISVLAILLILNTFGCENTDSHGRPDSDALTERAKDKAPKETTCDFGSGTLSVDNTYTVSIENTDLKPEKKYAVEIEIGGSIQSTTGAVEDKGILFIELKPATTGNGTISVLEVEIKTGKEKRKLKASCAFDVENENVDEGDSSDNDEDVNDDENVTDDEDGDDGDDVGDDSVEDYPQYCDEEYSCGYYERQAWAYDDDNECVFTAHNGFTSTPFFGSCCIWAYQCSWGEYRLRCHVRDWKRYQEWKETH